MGGLIHIRGLVSSLFRYFSIPQSSELPYSTTVLKSLLERCKQVRGTFLLLLESGRVRSEKELVTIEEMARDGMAVKVPNAVLIRL